MVLVTGAALTPFNRRKDGSSFRDWAADAFAQAIAMANIERRDIDYLVVASESDFFSLQLNPASVLASDLGLLGTAAIRVEGGGASGQLAVHTATQVIMSGLSRHAAVIGFDPCASQLPAQTVKSLYGFSFDGWTEGMTGVSASVLYALSIQRFMARTGATDLDLAEITINNRNNACSNPNAHLPLRHTVGDFENSQMIASPYRKLHCSPLSDGAAALVLSHPDATPEARNGAPQIIGIGAAFDHVHLGARRDPGKFFGKTRAMQRACDMAGLKPADIGLAEIYDAYAGAQLQGLEALGLSQDVVADQRKGRFHPDGALPVNLSGGLLGQGAPAGAIGVAQTATCALALEGAYHAPLQPGAAIPYALADTHGGIATNNAVTILAAGGRA